MVRIRVLVGMTVGALVAAFGALFLGEYEFDEALPIAAGPIMALVIAEIVVGVGRDRSIAMAAIVATWVVTAIVLAGHLDANGVGPVKPGAYISAGLAALAVAIRIRPSARDRAARSSEVSPTPVAPLPDPLAFRESDGSPDAYAPQPPRPGVPEPPEVWKPQDAPPSHVRRIQPGPGQPEPARSPSPPSTSSPSNPRPGPAEPAVRPVRAVVARRPDQRIPPGRSDRREPTARPPGPAPRRPEPDRRTADRPDRPVAAPRHHAEPVPGIGDGDDEWAPEAAPRPSAPPPVSTRPGPPTSGRVAPEPSSGSGRASGRRQLHAPLPPPPERPEPTSTPEPTSNSVFGSPESTGHAGVGGGVERDAPTLDWDVEFAWDEPAWPDVDWRSDS